MRDLHDAKQESRLAIDQSQVVADVEALRVKMDGGPGASEAPNVKPVRWTSFRVAALWPDLYEGARLIRGQM